MARVVLHRDLRAEVGHRDHAPLSRAPERSSSGDLPIGMVLVRGRAQPRVGASARTRRIFRFCRLRHRFHWRTRDGMLQAGMEEEMTGPMERLAGFLQSLKQAVLAR